MKISTIYRHLEYLSVHQIACIFCEIPPALFARLAASCDDSAVQKIDAYTATVAMILQALYKNSFAGELVLDLGVPDINKSKVHQASFCQWAVKNSIECGYYTVGAGDMYQTNNPQYSVRFAAAARAWQAIAVGEINPVSIKGISNWLEARAVILGIADDDGSVTAKLLSSIAYVVFPGRSVKD
jgi:hypothetical protein